MGSFAIIEETNAKESIFDRYMLRVTTVHSKRFFAHPVLVLCALIFLAHAVLWIATGYLPFERNDYNSYAIQAQSWLSGRLDVDYYPWLEQAVYEGKYFISFPPLPSVILLPLVVLFGLNTPDHLLSFLAALFGALCAFDMAKRAGKTDTQAVFWSAFLCIGSNLIFVSMLGWVWYIAQSFAFCFTMAAFRFACLPGNKNMGFSLFFLACAVGCRPLNVLFFPVLFYLLWQKLPEKSITGVIKRWYLFIAPGLVALFLCTLNYARFGSIAEFGHNYLPEFLESPNGQFHLSYIPYNLFRSVRLYSGNFEMPKFDGWAFYLVMPICLSALLSPIIAKQKPDRFFLLTVLCMILHLLATCAHKTMGGWHFGCRYLIDALPLSYLVCLHFGKERRETIFDYALFILGMAVNLIGTIWFYLS